MATPAAAASSVDPREVDYYTKFAALWWDASGPFWPLHRLNEVRVPFIVGEACRRFGLDTDQPLPLAGVRVLDIGCGGGILAESMARLGADVQGIDVVERNIAIATHHARQSEVDVHYELTTAEALSDRGETFDLVLTMEVVEHVADLEGFMDACCSLVKPGGLMFVATINRTVLALMIAIIGAEYVLRWMPKGTHRWSWFRTPGEIEILLGQHGLALERMIGVGVNPFSKAFFLTPVKRVNYMLSAVKVG